MGTAARPRFLPKGYFVHQRSIGEGGKPFFSVTGRPNPSHHASWILISRHSGKRTSTWRNERSNARPAASKASGARAVSSASIAVSHSDLQRARFDFERIVDSRDPPTKIIHVLLVEALDR